MRAVQVALVFAACGLGEPWYPFKPKAQGVPVDETDDPQGKQGKLHGVPGQPAGGQCVPLTRDCAGQRALRRLVVVDLHGKPIPRQTQGEVEGHIDIRERRHVKVFGLAEVESP